MAQLDKLNTLTLSEEDIKNWDSVNRQIFRGISIDILVVPDTNYFFQSNNCKAIRDEILPLMAKGSMFVQLTSIN